MTGWPADSPHPVLKLLGGRVGLAFRSDQMTHALGTIERAMRRRDVKSPYDFTQLLRDDSQAMDELIDALTVGETYFFRELRHFEFLRDQVLPKIRQRHGADHIVRMWSAACASGEEVYSLAMLCYEVGLSDKKVHILGTDISSEAMAKAKRAVYRRWSLRGEGAQLAKRHLKQLDQESFAVDERIRRMVRLEFLNLATDLYPSAVGGTSRLDVILCRNVLIYFNKETVQEVAKRLIKCLTPGGWLITASGDPPLDQYVALEHVVTDHGVFYRRPRNEPWVADSVQPSMPISPLNSAAGSLACLPASPQKETSGPPNSSNAETSFETLAKLLTEARNAFEHGDYQRAARMTESRLLESEVSALHVKALANIDAEVAETKCREVIKQHPMAAELHHLHAVLLMEVNRNDEAFKSTQRAIHLDGGLAMAHFTSGSILQRQGNLRAARLFFRNVLKLCDGLPPNQAARLAEGETVGELAEAAETRLSMIQAAIRGHRD